MRASESLAPRQADAASFCTIAFAGRIKALDGGKRRTKEVPRGKFPPEPRRVQIGVESSKFGMAGSLGML
jgi:hypothetical protein